MNSLKLCSANLLLSIFCLLSSFALAETQSALQTDLFIDSYYAYDVNEPSRRERQFTTQAFYNNEPAINLTSAGLRYNGQDLRGRVAAQYGSSVESNYAAEPDLFWRYIQESYVGFKIADGLWIDGGIFLSHLGPESWISKDNINYTRSLISEFSPYYQTGVRLDWQANSEFSAQLWLLNGWQNISDDRDPAFGTQLKWIPNEKWTYVYNNFIGRETDGTRVFQDFIVSRSISKALFLTAAFDLGYQSLSGDLSSAWWWGSALMAGYKLTDDTTLGLRFEKYSDPHEIIAATNQGQGFQVSGLSANLDVNIDKSVLWRSEIKGLLAGERIFDDSNGTNNDELLLVTSLSFFFS